MFVIKKIKITSLILLGLVLLTIHNKQAVAQENIKLSKATLLEKRIELPSKNIEAKVVRVIFPPAFVTPWHTHEGPGPRYVVKGRLKVVEGGKATIYSAGETFWESGDLMSVENMGETPAELIIFELAPSK
jgi:quercetin dioxygenase-like cupin family protein